MTEQLDRERVSDVAAVCDLFLTLSPQVRIATAVDVICDFEGIPSDFERRTIRRLLEHRLDEEMGMAA